MHRVNRNNCPNMDNAATKVREPFTIPEGYKVPHVALEPHERALHADRTPHVPFAGRRPRKTLYIVSFKCSRVGVFYLLDNTGLQVAEGDMVIVEAGAVNPNAAVYGKANGNGNPNQPSTRPPRDAFQNLKPKAIKRMACRLLIVIVILPESEAKVYFSLHSTGY